MKADAMVALANTVLLFAQRAVDLRHEARNYRALGKEQLADLLDQEADQSEESARKALARCRCRHAEPDGKSVQQALLKLKRRNGRGLGLA